MLRGRGTALSDSGGQTGSTLRALPRFPMVRPHAPMTTASLLLVEDDEFVRLSLARALNRAGVFSVLPAENGQQALELLDGQQVDAILTDLQMPVMDGLTLLGHLLERGAALPVAVMTGHRITPDLRERLQQYGIVRWTDPKLEIFYKRTPRERTIKESLQHILMEAARLLDESGPTAPAREHGGRHQEAATPVEPRRPEVQAALAEAMTMDGALGIALIDAANGLSLGTAGGSDEPGVGRGKRPPGRGECSPCGAAPRLGEGWVSSPAGRELREDGRGRAGAARTTPCTACASRSP